MNAVRIGLQVLLVLGGLFLTLLILPSLYPWLAARRKRDAHASEAESL